MHKVIHCIIICHFKLVETTWIFACKTEAEQARWGTHASGEKMRKTLSKPIRRDFQGHSVKWRKQSPKEYRTLALSTLERRNVRKYMCICSFAQKKCRKDKTESSGMITALQGFVKEEGMGFGVQGWKRGSSLGASFFPKSLTLSEGQNLHFSCKPMSHNPGHLNQRNESVCSHRNLHTILHSSPVIISENHKKTKMFPHKWMVQQTQQQTSMNCWHMTPPGCIWRAVWSERGQPQGSHTVCVISFA